MGLVQHTVRGKIPHLRIATGDLKKRVRPRAAASEGWFTYILFHAQEGFPRPVLAVPHVTELAQILLDGLLSVLAPVAGVGALFASTLPLDLFVYGPPVSVTRTLRTDLWLANIPPQWQT